MDKPNVIIITLDECKASAMSPYGNTNVITPAAERAARDGITFENAFTSHPKCVPSRCCLLSGRYAHTGGHRTLPGFELRKEEENLTAILKREGYVTGMFGKNHTVEEYIKHLFFDEYTTEIKRPARKKALPDAENMPFDDPVHRSFYRGRWEELFDGEHHDYYHVEESVRFIENHRNEPFFLLANLNLPHPVYFEMPPYADIIRQRGIALPLKEPLESTPETLKSYRKAYDLEMLNDSDWENIVVAYHSMVSYIDNCVVKIFDAVESLGLKDNTLIIYTSDHGDFAGEHVCVEKFDTFFYECIVKIPLLIQYPPLLKGGLRLDSLVENVDIMPTVLDILNLPIPEDVHGKSLLPYMTGKAAGHKDEVFCEGGVEESAIKNAPHYDDPKCARMKPNYYWKQKVLIDYPDSMQRSKMVRTKEWKLVYRQNGEKELYNLIEDPNEFINRADDPHCREVLLDLMDRLIRWMMRTEPDSPTIENLYA